MFFLGFDIIASKVFYKFLAEDRRFRFYLLKGKFYTINQTPLEHPGLYRRIIAIVSVNIPSVKDDIFKISKTDKILNEGNPMLIPLAQSNGSHLGQ